MNITTNLNENQLRAVTMALKPTRVIAGPGSGKTHVIIHRIAYMIEALSCRPDQILVITFTKAAAEEMRMRYSECFGGKGVTFGTFHSIFFRILKFSNAERYQLDNLLLEDQKKKMIEELYRQMDCDEYEDFVEVFLAHLTLMKNQMIAPKYYHPDGLAKELFSQVYHAYEDKKERMGKFDFDDMLLDCYHALTQEPQLLTYFQKRYQYILIDEFQDINCVQFEVIKLLASKHRNLFIVGDDDQSIYGFRGSKPEFLLQFSEYFKEAEDVVLDVNYRSTKNILSYSNNLILHNQKRYNKVMKSFKGEGVMPQIIYCEDVKEEAVEVTKAILKHKETGQSYSECAVIYRTNIQARPMIEMLLGANIPFCLKDTMVTLYDQWITKDILAYLRLAQNPRADDYVLKIINRPSRYISKAHQANASSLGEGILFNLLKIDTLSDWQKDPVQQLIYHLQVLRDKPLKEAIAYIRKVIGYDEYVKEYAKFRRVPPSGLMEVLDEIEDSVKGYTQADAWEEALYEQAMSIKQSTKLARGQDAVVLTTMHSAKGLEFHTVCVLDANDGVTPHNKSIGDAQLEEERRLFYVGLTRAKVNLLIFAPKKRYNEKVPISPFVLEMRTPQTVLEPGTKVVHKVYGTAILSAVAKPKGKLLFNDGTTRIVDLDFCIKNNIMWVEESK
ncbi:MAG: ATP-dependent helicase [Cellulosilyticaceae bacterium]